MIVSLSGPWSFVQQAFAPSSEEDYSFLPSLQPSQIQRLRAVLATRSFTLQYSMQNSNLVHVCTSHDWVPGPQANDGHIFHNKANDLTYGGCYAHKDMQYLIDNIQHNYIKYICPHLGDKMYLNIIFWTVAATYICKCPD